MNLKIAGFLSLILYFINMYLGTFSSDFIPLLILHIPLTLDQLLLRCFVAGFINDISSGFDLGIISLSYILIGFWLHYLKKYYQRDHSLSYFVLLWISYSFYLSVLLAFTCIKTTESVSFTDFLLLFIYYAPLQTISAMLFFYFPLKAWDFVYKNIRTIFGIRRKIR